MTAKISITARVLNTPRDLEGFDVPIRECRYHDELDQVHDGYYLYETFDARLCNYTCSLQRTEMEFDCVPWDIVYPHVDRANRICQGQRAVEFKKRLENHSISMECAGCQYPSCHSFSYFSLVSLLLEL